MEKQYYFLAGLFRSGNTVLASILNQNPNIYTSSLSPVFSIINQTDHYNKYSENALTNDYSERTSVFIKNILKTYYQDIDKKIIIDRHKGWAIPTSTELLKEYVDKKPKIIFTIRPLVEVVSSLININGKNYFDIMSKDPAFVFKTYLSDNDNIARFLLRTNDSLDMLLCSYNNLLQNQQDEIVHVVKYQDLLLDPENTLFKIYDFFDMERFNHDFNTIKNTSTYNDIPYTPSKELHKIRTSISSSGLKPENILSKNMIDSLNSIDPYYILKL